MSFSNLAYEQQELILLAIIFVLFVVGVILLQIKMYLNRTHVPTFGELLHKYIFNGYVLALNCCALCIACIVLCMLCGFTNGLVVFGCLFLVFTFIKVSSWSLATFYE